MSTLIAKAVAFIRAHGVDLAATYVGSVATLVLSHTAPLTGSALLSLFIAAVLTLAKAAGSPAWLVSALAALEAKFSKTPPSTPGK